MKKLCSFGILCFSMSKLLGAGTIDKDGKFHVINADLRELLISMIPPEQMGADDPDTLELARRASVGIPYNAVLRQILLLPENGKNESKIAEEVFEDESIGKLYDEQMAERFFLDKLLYIKWDLSSSDTKKIKLLDSILKGLVLEFDPAYKKTFCIFERSASQQRQNTLVMIDETLVKKVEPCIRCGIPEDQEVIASKFAAYRALMLTSGICISDTEKYFDSDSVLVIPDDKVSDWKKMLKAFPALNPNSSDGEMKFATVTKDRIENGVIKGIQYSDSNEDKSNSYTLFDGEGLISKEFGEFLSAQISSSSPKAASFQVRMPFVKGVLHKVDFHAMFRELLRESYETTYIEDYCKKRVLLKDVHMILTTSMFKEYKVYRETAKKVNKKGIDYYFDEFKKWNHRLFISNSDEMFDNPFQITVANYQFLSTLKTTGLESDLLAPSLNAVWSARQSHDSNALCYLYRHGMKQEFWDDPDEAEQEDEETDENKTFSDLLKKNTLLMRSAAFRDCIRTDELMKEMSYGHLIEPGDMRYLSGDLMQLCCLLTRHLCRQNADGKYEEIDTKDNEILQGWVEEAKALDSAEFYYAPGVTAGQKASVCRNPHLARNEHVVLTAMTPGSNRETYFGHLHGVVMLQVGRDSNVSRLGGADFDGDIVRLFYDSAYRSAAQPGEEPLPPLLIPSLKANAQKYDEECRKELVRRASGSRVGLFSNLAFRTSLFAYGARTEKSKTKEENDLVKLSCMVGLEIDAVKTGVKPQFIKKDFSVQQHIDDIKPGKDPYCLNFFLEYKDAVKRKQTFQMRFSVPDKNCGSLTMTEYLPYIFAPNALDIQEERIEQWAGDCHKLLWCKKPEKVKQEDQVDEKKAKFKRCSDPLTEYKPERVYLWELLEEEPEETDLSPEMFDAYCVSRALLARLSRRSQFQENGEALETLRLVLLQNYGSKRGAEYLRELQEWGQWLVEMIDKDDSDNLRLAIGRLLPWEQLPGAALRRDRFNYLAKKHGLDFRCELNDDFDKYCCQLPKQPRGSKLLVSLLLSDLTKEEFETELGVYLKQTGIKDNAKKKIEKLWAEIQEKDKNARTKVSNELFEEKTFSWSDNDRQETCDWISETDNDKRYAFLCSVLFSGDTIPPDKEQAARFLAAPINWQVLPALLVYLIQKESTIRWRKNIRMLRQKTTLEILRLMLIQNYGSEQSAEYLRELQKWSQWLIETIGKEDSNSIRLAIGRLLPWEQLPGAVLRRDRFNYLAKKHGLDFHCEANDDFDRYCCQLQKQPRGSKLLVSLLLSDLKEDEFEIELDVYLNDVYLKQTRIKDNAEKRIEKDSAKKKIVKLRAEIQKKDKKARNKVSNELFEEKTFSWSESDKPETCDWISETDNDKRYAFLGSVLFSGDTIPPDKERAARFLADPINWQVLPALLVYLMPDKQINLSNEELIGFCRKVMDAYKTACAENENIQPVANTVKALLQLEDEGISEEEWSESSNSNALTVGATAVPLRIVMLYGLLRSYRFDNMKKNDLLAAVLGSAVSVSDSKQGMTAPLMMLLGAEKKGVQFDGIRNIEEFILSAMKDVLYDKLKKYSCFERVETAGIDSYTCGFLDGSQGIELTPVKLEGEDPVSGSLTVTAKTIILYDEASNKTKPEDLLKERVALEWSSEHIQPEIRMTTDSERLSRYERELKLLRLFAVPFEIGYFSAEKWNLLCRGELTCLRLPGSDQNAENPYKQIAMNPLELHATIQYPNGKAIGTLRKTKPLDGFIWGYQLFKRTETEQKNGGGADI